MSSFLGNFFYLSLLCVLGLTNTLHASGESLSDLELSKIIEQQNRLLRHGKDWSEDELTRQAQQIVTSYESYLLENPNDVNALLLFGKFLRKTGLHESAVSLFLQADQINPNIAVVKQEIGNFLVEDGKVVEAFPFFLMTTRLAPHEPIYHYNLGNFIFLFEDKLSRIEESTNLGMLMHESFKEAVKLDPKNFDYHLRFAQSFFDFEHVMQQEALIAWDTLSSEFGVRSRKEEEYINFNKARILLEIGKKQEAMIMLRSIKSESLQKERNQLLKKAKDENEKRLKKSSQIKGPYNHFPYISSNLFPSDPNLRRMKVVTSKLRQERMLKEFQFDVIQARILANGDVSLELTQQALSNESLK